MALTKQKYGIVVTLSSLVLGGALWFVRAGYMFTVDDIVVLYQGYVERCLVTQYGAATNRAIATNYWQYTVTGEEGLSHFIADPAAPSNSIAKPYSTVGFEAVPDPGSFSIICAVEPPDFYGSYRDIIYTNKFIMGIYSNITVSGLSSPYDSANGVYAVTNNKDWSLLSASDRARWGDSLIYVKVGNNEQTVEFTYDRTFLFFDYPWTILSKRLAPWVATPLREGVIDVIDYWWPVWNEQPDITDYTITATGLDANKLFDGPLFLENVYRGWPIKHSLDSWDRSLGKIDNNGWPGYGDPSGGLLSAGVPIQPGPNVKSTRSLLRPELKIYTNDASIELSSSVPVWHMEPSLFNTSVFSNEVDLVIDLVNFQATVGGVLTNYPGFPDIKFFKFTDNSISNFYAFYPFLQGVYKLRKSMLTERRDALKYLQTTYHQSTAAYPPIVTWTPTNVYSWSYYAGTSWLHAVETAIAAGPTENSIIYDSRPRCFSQGQRVNANLFYFYAEAYSGSLNLSIMNSNLSSKACFYANASVDFGLWDPPPHGYESITGEVTKVFYEPFGLLSTSVFSRIEVEANYSFKSNSFSTIIFGTNNPTIGDFLTEEPLLDQTATQKGFVITDEGIMVDWTFTKCVD